MGVGMFVFGSELMVLLALLSPASSSIVSVTSSLLGKGKKLAVAPLQCLVGLSVHKCAMKCEEEEQCQAYNYNEAAGVCEVLGNLDPSASLVATQGWDSFRNLQQITVNNMDPCASNPCSTDTVCVSYMPLSRVPHRPLQSLNYSVPSYACSAHEWLLDERTQGRTSCSFTQIDDVDWPAFDITHGVWNYYDNFVKCEQHKCLSLLCLFSPDEPQYCWLKSSKYLLHGDIVPSKLDYIYWYPECH